MLNESSNQPAATDEQHTEYIGDGVYVSFDGYHFWLRTQRTGGMDVIALEPSVRVALVKYMERVWPLNNGEPDDAQRTQKATENKS